MADNVAGNVADNAADNVADNTPLPRDRSGDRCVAWHVPRCSSGWLANNVGVVVPVEPAVCVCARASARVCMCVRVLAYATLASWFGWSPTTRHGSPGFRSGSLDTVKSVLRK